ncbi:MAG: hypothetical protein MPK75_12780, partial [Alphaproteobacteria bacterium]|nr:hypothetical protein [Alphaproteobacteria bacterium]
KMKIYRAFAAAFVALFLLSACSDPVADARDAAERAHIAHLRVGAANGYVYYKKINSTAKKTLKDLYLVSAKAFLAAYQSAQAAAVAPSEYAAKQRATNARTAAKTAEESAKATEKVVLSIYPAYNAKKSLDDMMAELAADGFDNIDKSAKSVATYLSYPR